MWWFRARRGERAEVVPIELRRLRRALRTAPGFAMKPEALEATLKVRTVSLLRWVGAGREPRRTRRVRAVEWLRVHVLRMAPRWVPLSPADVWRLPEVAGGGQSDQSGGK